VRLPWNDLTAGAWLLEDRVGGEAFERDGAQLTDEGLYVALEPWASHFLGFSPQPAQVAPAPAGTAGM
jgi:hypothetical protein